jgi:hypothetical protein
LNQGPPYSSVPTKLQNLKKWKKNSRMDLMNV